MGSDIHSLFERVSNSKNLTHASKELNVEEPRIIRGSNLIHTNLVRSGVNICNVNFGRNVPQFNCRSQIGYHKPEQLNKSIQDSITSKVRFMPPFENGA